MRVEPLKYDRDGYLLMPTKQAVIERCDRMVGLEPGFYYHTQASYPSRRELNRHINIFNREMLNRRGYVEISRKTFISTMEILTGDRHAQPIYWFDVVYAIQ